MNLLLGLIIFKEKKSEMWQLCAAMISWVVCLLTDFNQPDKVENIEEDSLDSIPSPSPSVKIQIIGGKVYLR